MIMPGGVARRRTSGSGIAPEPPTPRPLGVFGHDREPVGERSVALVGGVLVDHRRPHARVAEEGHDLLRRRAGLAARVPTIWRRSWNRRPPRPTASVAGVQ